MVDIAVRCNIRQGDGVRCKETRFYALSNGQSLLFCCYSCGHKQTAQDLRRPGEGQPTMPEEVVITALENHTRKWEGRSFIHHTAEVTVTAPIQEDPQDNNMDILIHHASIKAGYHPHGYGIYGNRTCRTIGPNKYYLEWKTGASCD